MIFVDKKKDPRSEIFLTKVNQLHANQKLFENELLHQKEKYFENKMFKWDQNEMKQKKLYLTGFKNI